MPSLTASILLVASVAAVEPQVLTDPGTFGPALQIAHYYYGQMPTGIAVSRESRLFSTYPACLDGNNTNTPQTPNKYQVAELMPDGSEVPYPSVEMNSPPGGALNMSTNPPTSANYDNYLIGCQSAIVDSQNVLYILDSGRAVNPDSGALLSAVYGGPKVITVDLSTNKVIRTYKFPQTVVYSDSFLNDIRVDRTPGLSGLTSNGSEGVAYITDSSLEGRNGFVILDLTSGESWRHLDNDPRVHAKQQVLPWVNGNPVLFAPQGQPYSRAAIGSDGIALGADGKDLYFSVISGRELFSAPTAALRAHDASSELVLAASITNKGEKGISDGLETDSNGVIYAGNVEQEAVVSYFPSNSSVQTFVRDPRINWADTLSVGWDGFLYFTVNQVHLMPNFYPGTERRQHPGEPWEKQSINQTRYEPLRAQPAPIFIETKTTSGTQDSANVQLGIWVAAWYERMRTVAAQAGIEERLLTLPVIQRVLDDDCRIGNTNSIIGIYQLQASIAALGRWVEETFTPWITDLLTRAVEGRA